MNKKIVVYKSLEDYNKSFELLKKEYKNLQMTIVDDVKKVKDFSFKDYDLVISYNFNNLEKKILNYYTSLDELNQAEIDIIALKKAELKEYCLNILDGGDGGWDYVNNNCLNGNSYPRTKESRHYSAMAGGMGNKNRLENEEELHKWKLKCSYF